MALTSKQEAFAQLMARGENGEPLTMSDCYRRAYSAAKMKAGSIHREASLLVAHPMVAQRIETIRRGMERSNTAVAVSDKERSLNKLRTLMDKAETESVQLQAAIWLGKSAAAFTEVTRTETVDSSPEQIEREIEKMLAEAEAKGRSH